MKRLALYALIAGTSLAVSLTNATQFKLSGTLFLEDRKNYDSSNKTFPGNPTHGTVDIDIMVDDARDTFAQIASKLQAALTKKIQRAAKAKGATLSDAYQLVITDFDDSNGNTVDFFDPTLSNQTLMNINLDKKTLKNKRIDFNGLAVQ